MSDALGALMERNLVEVFGQRDPARRAAAIAELYAADCTFFEAEGRLLAAMLRRYVFKNASRSALIVSASVVGMPCGKPL